MQLLRRSPQAAEGLRWATTRSSMERTWKNERSCSGVTSSRNLRPHRLEPRKAGRRISLCPVVPDPEADGRECTTEVATWRRANTPAGTDTRHRRRRRAGSETRRLAPRGVLTRRGHGVRTRCGQPVPSRVAPPRCTVSCSVEATRPPEGWEKAVAQGVANFCSRFLVLDWFYGVRID